MIEQTKHYQALNQWFESPLGVCIAKEFAYQLESVQQYLRGDNLLQLGTCGDNLWLDVLKYQHKWFASPFLPDSNIHLQCSFNQIPLSRKSVDCVVVPLTLEPFGKNSLSLIDEIDRVLKPAGFIVLFSINPWSLWGAAIKSGVLHCYANHKIKMHTAFNLNRIFLQRGYWQCSLSNFGYIPPINNKELIKKLSFFDEVGKMIWPFPSGLYCYIAQKHEYINPLQLAKEMKASRRKDYKSPLQPVIRL